MAKKFDKLLDRATDATLLDPAWESILICVDSVKSGEISPKIALECLRKRYRQENPHVAHHALLVLEALVKNCGEKMHKEIACQEFMQDLKRLIEERQAEKIKEKILQLIQCWSHAFRNKPEYKFVVDTHNLMKLEGYTFPPMRESDAMFDAESAPEWFDGDKCHRCNVDFGLFTRKHHCRNCGQVFCDKCSGKSIPLPHIGIEAEVRVCETCFDKIKNKLSISTSKNNLADAAKGSVEKEVDSKGPSSKSTATTVNEKETEFREQEELQLALAISQSEAEEKERQKQRQLFNFYGGSFAPDTSPTTKTKGFSESLEQKNSTGYLGTLEKSPSPINTSAENNETDGELAKYLNRGYWEARRTEHKRGILRQSPTPSAPPAAPAGEQTTSDVILNGKGPENGLGATPDGTDGVTSPEFSHFVDKLRLGVEIFVNRIRNDVARGRPVITDSSVQSMFVNLTAMHAQLLQHMAVLDDQRGFYESLQDKLAQIKDAREAMDALREEHAQRRQAELLEMQRQQQVQMATKLDVMRQKKHEMLEQQRLLAMQRIDEQRREMEARRQAQIHHQQQQQQQQMIASPHQQMPQQAGFGQEAGSNAMHQMAPMLSGSHMSNYPVTVQPTTNQQQPQTQTFANQYSIPQPTHHQQTFAQQPQMPGLSQASHQQQQQQIYANQQQSVYPQAYSTNAVYTVAGPAAPHLQYTQQYGAQQQNVPPAHQQQFSAPQAPYYYQQPDPSTLMSAASMGPVPAPYVYPSYPGPQVASFPAPYPYYQPQQHGANVVPGGAQQPTDQASPNAQLASNSTTEGQLISFD